MRGEGERAPRGGGGVAYGGIRGHTLLEACTVGCASHVLCQG